MNKIVNYAREVYRRHSEMCCAVCFLVTASILYLIILKPLFETNDDSAMAAIAYGVTGTPGTRLVFVNFVIGIAVNLLVTALPGVAWYGVIQMTVVLASLFVILYLIFKRFGVSLGVFPALIVLLIFCYQFMSLLQFSKTAAIATIAGVLLMFDAIDKNSRKWQYFAAAALMLIGSMYRITVFAMQMILWAAVGVVFLIRYIKERDAKSVLRLVIPFVLVFSLAFGLEAANGRYYAKDEQWASFTQYNALRSDLLDYSFPDYEQNKELYDSLGVSENDLTLYQSWDFGDPETFTVELMESLVDAVPAKTFSAGTLFDFCKSVLRGYIKYAYFPAVILAVVFCALTIRKRDVSSILLICYEILAFGAVQFYLFFSGRYLINRVDVGFFFGFFILLIFHGTGRAVPKLSRRVFTIVLCIVMMYGTVAMVVSSEDNYVRAQVKDSEINELVKSDSEHIYFQSTSSGVPSPLIGVFDYAEKGSQANTFPLGGWRIQSPMMYEVWDNFGITNPFRDIVNDPDAYVICNGDISMIMDHIREHYYPLARADLIKLVDDRSMFIYRVTTGDPRLPDKPVADGTDVLDYSLSVYSRDDGDVLYGHISLDGENSFAANIYVGVISPSTGETIHYATQMESPISDDIMNGKYGSFFKLVDTLEPGSVVTLYLETADTLYSILTYPQS